MEMIVIVSNHIGVGLLSGPAYDKQMQTIISRVFRSDNF